MVVKNNWWLKAGMMALVLLSPLVGTAGSLSLLSGGQARFLQADEAFLLQSPLWEGKKQVRLEWRVERGYYLYRDRLHLAWEDAQGEQHAVKPVMPPAESKHDASFGTLFVYHHGFGLEVPFPAGFQPVSLHVRYQGCAESGYCYPPIDKVLAVPSVQGALAQQPVAASTSSLFALSEDQGQVQALFGQHSAWWLLPVFFLFGVGLSLTPCVLPMVPLLSGLLLRRGADLPARQALLLSTLFIVAMASTYALAGVAAALSGNNLQMALQRPSVLVAVSMVMVVLALSMFGIFRLQLPSSWQSKAGQWGQGRHGYLGIVVMGVGSALVVGPCVAPPLAAVLLYIGQTGDALLGGSALWMMGLGMGLPLWLFAWSAGRWMPRLGPWMAVVQRVFGFVLLALAIGFLERAFAGTLTMGLWFALGVSWCVYWGRLLMLWWENAGDAGRLGIWMQAGLGVEVASLCLTAVLLAGVFAGGKSVWEPFPAMVSRVAGAQSVVSDLAGVDQALAAARADRQPLVLDFYADWCVECVRMERTTLRQAGVQQLLQGVRWIKVDLTHYAEAQKILLQHYKVVGPPALLFFNSLGTEQGGLRTVGYLTAERLQDRLERLLQSESN